MAIFPTVAAWPSALRAMIAIGLFVAFLASPAHADEAVRSTQVHEALVRAASFYAGLSVRGSYVWKYSTDLRQRRGEGMVGPTEGWVQPPGTPAIGAAFLRVYEVTGDAAWLGAARNVASALIETQLLSGGWTNPIEMDPSAQTQWCYRARRLTPEDCAAIQDNRSRNRTLLDDDTTQSALRFLIWLDSLFDGHDEHVHDTVLFGLKRLVEAQYPAGAWPVMFDRRPVTENLPPLRQAKSLDDWSRTYVKPSGDAYYILNDNLIGDMVHLLLVAERYFADPVYLDAAKRAGEFLLKAQLPPPQEGWAQTYNTLMQPVWGRKFEPPAVASRETAGTVTCLLELYQRTGDRRFLAAARRAARWLRSVQLADGDWARFYELGTNRPLYVDNQERLTYDPSDLLSHYSMKGQKGINEALTVLQRVVQGQPFGQAPLWPAAPEALSRGESEARIEDLLKGQDGRGAWPEENWISSATFVNAVFLLAGSLEASRLKP
ncbi:hypothetical protein FHS85_005279 [Rhodoligotrophos appendicifer]|uniref:hypothetical protein n=1 Tax=Rhodoligotrophos appendicifer TaxID=987056 RepID=UPI001185D6C5|nr:hypothetical protein [Rhodoligotrophos appendicifer]